MKSGLGSDGVGDVHRCATCGFSAPRIDPSWASSGPDDPLVVTECPRCGSIQDVGSHPW